jgi:hypothetical protein
VAPQKWERGFRGRLEAPITASLQAIKNLKYHLKKLPKEQ